MSARRIKLPFKIRKPILACGADLKGAFALAEMGEAILYEGFGDLGNLENFEEYESAVRSAIRQNGIRPAVIICDMHPDYYSTRFAESFAQSPGGKRPKIKNVRLRRIQHHEAHIASAIIDGRITGDVIGIAFDGMGYGADGNIWGGEFFVGGLKGFKRTAHLDYIPMPGGDAAVREPWRMAESYIYSATKKCGDPIIKKMIDQKVNSPLTSSAGRLFDAVGSMVLGKRTARFEAELPIELEKLAAADSDDTYDFVINNRNSIILSCAPIIRGIACDIKKGVSKADVSAKFHNTVARMISDTVEIIGKKTGLKKAVFSGGVFQNQYLTGRASEALKRKGFLVFTHSSVNTNDAGIPIGQIAIAEKGYICV